MSEQKNCINCGAQVTYNFCSACGQATYVPPVSWKGLLTELTSRWLGMDNKIARTFKGLWLSPAIVINSYLEGNRRKYISPLSYLIVMSAAYLLSFQLFDITPQELMGSATETFQTEQTPDQQAFMKSYMQTFSDNMRLVVASLIPFMSLSLILFYKNRNFLENFLVVSFITSQAIWLSILGLAIFAITGQSVLWPNFAINLLYTVWVFGLLNPQKRKLWTYIKALIVWLVGYIFYTITIFIIAVALLLTLATRGG